ncbi:MAG: hypothetical protein JWQ89_2958 [Devosia sp.]|uniref:DUF3168 domain-containing protein n=1 Tax=Devosia sp. TaxID=1871048 RepID=UPI0026365D0C|nr:DUF3168 domain-containing protein [Devosia sp.]MDB5541231.1 hypothetical protein [Devosia sp.]
MAATCALDILRGALEGESAVTAKVGARIYPVEAPQQATMPSLVLHLVDERDERMLSGAGRYPVARFIVDCIGETFGQAAGLGLTVKDALRDWTGTVEGFSAYFDCDEIDHFDRGERGDLWRRRLGFEARFRAA